MLKLNSGVAEKTLTIEEFLRKFLTYLPANVRKNIVPKSSKNTLRDESIFEYQIYAEGNYICLLRHFTFCPPDSKDESWYWEDKDAGHFVYNMMFAGNIKRCPDYQKMLKQKSKALPVRTELNKDTLNLVPDYYLLSYFGKYVIPITEPLTDSYARKLADQFVEGNLVYRNNSDNNPLRRRR